MRLTATAPELVASEDHAYVACVGDQLTLFDSESRRALATAALPAGAQLGFLGNRLLTVVPGASTRLALLALPTLEPVAEAELEGRLRLLALTGSRALVATDGLEQPRVIGLLGTKLLVEPIGMREPLLE